VSRARFEGGVEDSGDVSHSGGGDGQGRRLEFEEAALELQFGGEGVGLSLLRVHRAETEVAIAAHDDLTSVLGQHIVADLVE